MADAQKIAMCDKCGGAGGLEMFVAGRENRWRVKCARCQHMTPHFRAAALAVKLWNSWAAGGKADVLAG